MAVYNLLDLHYFSCPSKIQITRFGTICLPETNSGVNYCSSHGTPLATCMSSEILYEVVKEDYYSDSSEDYSEYSSSNYTDYTDYTLTGGWVPFSWTKSYSLGTISN